MLITLLSYLDCVPQNENRYDDSPTGSIVRDAMPTSDNMFGVARDEDGWEQVSIPISVEEDYEIVIPPSDFPTRDNAPASTTTTTTSSSGAHVGIFQRLRAWQNQRSLQRDQLGPSISKTFAELSNENPDQMEEEAIKRAIELSMLDVALVQSKRHRFQHEQHQKPPHKILDVAENASPAEIKTAYRRLARLHHPDKGGEARRFEEVARAYRSLLSSTVSRLSTSVQSCNTNADGRATPRLTTATCDRELQDHRRLVNDLFQADGMDLNACVTKQLRALDMFGLTFKDAGAINRNERNEIIHNSCFYLSLATSYLWGIGALSFTNNEKEEDELLVGETALLLKRTIEAAVVKAHPEWVLQGKVGEEVQAFSDFLVYTLDSHTLLSDWTVVVFDTTSGFCDIFKGKNYENQKSMMQSNTITLRYIPGHYQALVPSCSLARRPTLGDIITTLDGLEAFYVVTDVN